MQSAALTTVLSSPLPPRPITSPPIPKLSSSSSSTSTRFTSLRSNAQAVNYSSAVSVFPAEACETIGGDACLADMYPEAKLKPEEASNPKTATASVAEAVEREYLDYAGPKTVLLGDACDVLGGEFCDPPYQTGIY